MKCPLKQNPPKFRGILSKEKQEKINRFDLFSMNTRKYPLRRYILGVLMHTTAWDQHWEAMKYFYVSFKIWCSALPCLIM